MTRPFVFLLGFFLGFSLEVQVQAAERVQLRVIDPSAQHSDPHSSALLEEPRNCLAAATTTCAIRIGEGRQLTLRPDAHRTWTLPEKTIAVRLAKDRLRFIEGSLKISGKETVVETEQGEITVRGEAFIDRGVSKLTIVNTGNEPIEFRGLGWSAAYEIPVGLETQVDLPNVKNGRTAVGLPLPLDYENQVVREARIFQGKKEEFAKRLDYLVELRSQAAQVSADLHRQVVERKIATVESEKEVKRQASLRREARDRELRALFRRKVLNPD